MTPVGGEEVGHTNARNKKSTVSGAGTLCTFLPYSECVVCTIFWFHITQLKHQLAGYPGSGLKSNRGNKETKKKENFF